MAVAHTGLSLEEFLQLPEEKPALEYLDGVVSQKASGTGPHALLQVVVAMWLHQACEEDRTARVFTELHAHWPTRASLCPDVSLYQIERIPITADGEIAEDFWVPPDIAVEIASPGQSANQMTVRAQLLTELGVRVVVVVEPRFRRVRVARSGRGITSHERDDVVAFEDVLTSFSFVVRDLFATLQVRRPEAGHGS